MDPRSHNAPVTPPERFERLEQRLLTAADFASVRASVLHVMGTSSDDQIRVMPFKNDRVRVTVNGQRTAFDLARVKAIDVRSLRGDDTILVGGLADVRVRSGHGDDSITVGGTKGRHTVLSGPGHDWIRTDQSRFRGIDPGRGSDTVLGPAAVDAEFGPAALEYRFGGEMELFGTPGDDQIAIYYRPGQFIERPPLRVEVNGRGLDIEDPRRAGAPAVARIAIDARGGHDRVQVGSPFGGPMSSEPFEVPASVIGGTGNDTLVSAFGTDTLRGDAGNDWLNPGLGKDVLFGGDGDDRFVNRNPETTDDGDFIDGGPGDDQAEPDERDQYIDIELVDYHST